MAFSDTCLMFSVAIMNLICGVLGALMFCLAIWMRLETGVRDWVRELEMFQYWNGLYILMAAGAIILIIAFCGCCGALTNNILLLIINGSLTMFSFVFLLFGASILLANWSSPSFDYDHYRAQFSIVLNRKDAISDNFIIWLIYVGGGLMLVCLILEVAGGTVILLNGTESSQLTPFLQTTLNKLILDSNYDANANYYLQTVQEKVGCCGSRSYMDYGKSNLPIPDSCRDAISGNVYHEGCVEKFSIFIEKRAGWIAGIAIFVAVLQLLLICFTFAYIRTIRYHDDSGRKQRYEGVAQS